MSPTDAALRAAVAAAPDAALPRLVYADFLDDHDQPTLAAAVRLDVALAGERPWADRYWQLRAEQPADFPADLGRLADRQPLLCGVPDDWRSRWRAVRAFVSRWWGVPLGDVGRWTETTADLPAAVREWDAFAAELADASKEAFRDPIGLSRVPGHDALSLLEQAEGDTHWAVQDSNTGLDDPPVELFLLDYDRTEQFFVPYGRFTETTTGFALHYLLSYWPGQGSFADAPSDLALPDASRFDVGQFTEHPGHVEVLVPAGYFHYPHPRIGRFSSRSS